jgi:GAF domain-containing protein
LLHWELVPAAASASAATAEAVLSRLLLLARADLADDLAHGADGGESLARIVELARQWVPGVEHASVLVRLGDDKHETVASTGPLAVACDEAQAGSPSGPAHDVLAAHRTVRIHDLREDARWPRFAAPALQLGVRSVLICELPASHEAVGTLNLYAREPRAFGDVAELLAPVFASRAAILLAHGDQVNNLRREIDSRQVIAQTVNILMERHQITAEQALERLTRAARQT